MNLVNDLGKSNMFFNSVTSQLMRTPFHSMYVCDCCVIVAAQLLRSLWMSKQTSVSNYSNIIQTKP